MKKQILILLGILLLVSTIYAGVELFKSDSSISLSKDSKDKFTEKGININVKADSLTCNNKECWVDVYQEGIIKAQFRTSKDHCIYSEKNPKCDDEIKTKELEVECATFQVKCLSRVDYTPQELISMRDTFIKNRLEQYANGLKEDKSKSENVQIDSGGSITSI